MIIVAKDILKRCNSVRAIEKSVVIKHMHEVLINRKELLIITSGLNLTEHQLVFRILAEGIQAGDVGTRSAASALRGATRSVLVIRVLDSMLTLKVIGQTGVLLSNSRGFVVPSSTQDTS